jgi:adenylate cyclase
MLNPDSALPVAYKVGLCPWGEALEVQRRLRRDILALALVGAAAAIAASIFLARGLSRPLRELARGARRIEAGDYAVRITARSQDEVGQPADAFNQMAEGLALKEKYQHMLGMLAGKEVAQRLVTGQIALGGETREVTVLFCDIRGFTELTQAMPPPEVFRMLNEHMTALTRVIHEDHGVVDKFMMPRRTFPTSVAWACARATSVSASLRTW